MKYKVRLTKIKSTHNNLRTDVIEGITLELPEKGKSFTLFGESLTEGAARRLIITTEIQVVGFGSDGYLFVTKNSTYKLEVLDSNV